MEVVEGLDGKMINAVVVSSFAPNFFFISTGREPGNISWASPQVQRNIRYVKLEWLNVGLRDVQAR